MHCTFGDLKPTSAQLAHSKTLSSVSPQIDTISMRSVLSSLFALWTLHRLCSVLLLSSALTSVLPLTVHAALQPLQPVPLSTSNSPFAQGAIFSNEVFSEQENGDNYSVLLSLSPNDLGYTAKIGGYYNTESCAFDGQCSLENRGSYYHLTCYGLADNPRTTVRPLLIATYLPTSEELSITTMPADICGPMTNLLAELHGPFIRKSTLPLPTGFDLSGKYTLADSRHGGDFDSYGNVEMTANGKTMLGSDAYSIKVSTTHRMHKCSFSGFCTIIPAFNQLECINGDDDPNNFDSLHGFIRDGRLVITEGTVEHACESGGTIYFEFAKQARP